jgi:tyrosine-specific transport protein
MNGKSVQIILFIAGNAIGTSILELPVALGSAGFWPSLIAISILYGAMLYTGQILADFAVKTRSFNLPSLFRKMLDKPGLAIFYMAYFTLFFCLLVTYWIRLRALISPYCECLPPVIILLLFQGFRFIGPLNALLTAGLIAAFAVLIFFMLKTGNRIPMEKMSSLEGLNHSLSIILCSYGFHGTVPFLCRELNLNKKLIKKAIITGTLFPFIFNVIILLGSFRVFSAEELQRESKLPIFTLLCGMEGMHWCTQWGQIFSFLAIITSLIGISLTFGNALQDYFSEKSMKIFPLIVTVGLPFVFSICTPSIFIRILEFTEGILLNIITGILPLAMKIKVGTGHPLDCLLLVGFLYVFITTIL